MWNQNEVVSEHLTWGYGMNTNGFEGRNSRETRFTDFVNSGSKCLQGTIKSKCMF